MDKNERLRPIRVQLRRMMNGVTSATMRKEGADYALNYGVSLPQLKQYAESLTKDDLLADLLWEQRAREMKILACLLHPHETFDRNKAARWLTESPNIEIARILSVSLLQYMPYAEELALQLVLKERKEPSVIAIVAGYSLLTRLCMQGSKLSHADDSMLFESSVEKISMDNAVVQDAVMSFLKRWSAISEKTGLMIKDKINRKLENLSEHDMRKMLEDVKEEVDFLYG